MIVSLGDGSGRLCGLVVTGLFDYGFEGPVCWQI